MSVLANARHELFAQEVAKGAPAYLAYRLAGYQGDSASLRANAARLIANDSVQARIAELKEEGAFAAKVELTDIALELKRVGFSDIMNYWKVKPDGTPYLDLTALPKNHSAAIDGLTVEDTQYGKKVKIKLHNKVAALEKLGNHVGMFKERVELSVPEPVKVTLVTRDMSPQEAAEAYAQTLMEDK